MGRKSSITTLDPEIRERINALLKDGRHTLDEIKQQIAEAFPEAELPSRSALGRYAQRFEEIGKRMRESREVAKVWADRLGNEPQGDVGKLVMEMLRTICFDVTLDLQTGAVDEVDPKALNMLALAMQRLEAAGKWNLQREQAMREAVLEEAAERVDAAAKAQGLGAEQAKYWRQQVLGAF